MTKPTEETLSIDLIIAGEETQMRAGTRHETIEDYQQLLENSGTAWPFETKLVVFFDGDSYWLADGFHRYFACQANKRSSVECEIYQGTLEEAQDYALAANLSHGLRRSNDDKRKAVTAALNMPRWAKRSDKVVGDHIGVSDRFVGKIRKIISSGPNGSDLNEGTEDRVGADGKNYKVKKPSKTSDSNDSGPNGSDLNEDYEEVDDSEFEIDDSEFSEIVQKVRAVLRGKFNEDELPTEEAHCKVIAKGADDEAWKAIAENARERAGENGPKVRDYHEAFREEDWKHRRNLINEYGVLAMQNLDDLQEIKPSDNFEVAMKHIQDFLISIKGW